MSRSRRPAAARVPATPATPAAPVAPIHPRIGQVSPDGTFVNPLVQALDPLSAMRNQGMSQQSHPTMQPQPQPPLPLAPPKPGYVPPAPATAQGPTNMPYIAPQLQPQITRPVVTPQPAAEPEPVTPVLPAVLEDIDAEPEFEYVAPPETAYRWDIPDTSRPEYGRRLDVVAASVDAAREYLLTDETVTLDRIERAFVRGEEPSVVRLEVEVSCEHDEQIQRTKQLNTKLAAYQDAEATCKELSTTLEDLPAWFDAQEASVAARIDVAARDQAFKAATLASSLLGMREAIDRALLETGAYQPPATPEPIPTEGVVVNVAAGSYVADRIREALPGVIVVEREAGAELSDEEADGMEIIRRALQEFVRTNPMGVYESQAVRAAVDVIRERTA